MCASRFKAVSVLLAVNGRAAVVKSTTKSRQQQEDCGPRADYQGVPGGDVLASERLCQCLFYLSLWKVGDKTRQEEVEEDAGLLGQLLTG